jgi:hypothetical protein
MPNSPERWPGLPKRGEVKRHRLICLLVLATHLSGCSLLFVDGPRPKQPLDKQEPVVCSTSYAAPIVDTVLTGLAFVGAGIWATRSEEQARSMGTTQAGEIGIRMGIAGLTTASAIIGFTRLRPAASRMNRRNRHDDCRAPRWHRSRWSGRHRAWSQDRRQRPDGRSHQRADLQRPAPADPQSVR